MYINDNRPGLEQVAGQLSSLNKLRTVTFGSNGLEARSAQADVALANQVLTRAAFFAFVSSDQTFVDI